MYLYLEMISTGTSVQQAILWADIFKLLTLSQHLQVVVVEGAIRL